uniref:NADH-ubiquinone oxidoreductase chain 5 n=1 Tax=Derotettix mendosensis TaxID=2219932 RepID=A0A3S7MGH2_9HEMI|nr:NADH dehydrogenase subunit 5 [Derotettix mendosensis]
MTSNFNKYISLLLFFSSICFFIMTLYLIEWEYSIMLEWSIIMMSSCNMFMTIILDNMSCMFMSIVCFISSMVILYSSMYMKNDKTLSRFIYIIMMFVFSMIMLIISPNMISILLGWDGLGLVSYCLVIYYQNNFSSNAGMLTALMNRIGDAAIIITIAWMMNFGSWNFFCFIDKMNSDYMIFLIILAGFTKSAQIPFSSWLPAAMAAPTPVSALVHSSTLVTAGVYMLIRFNHLIIGNEYSMFIALIPVLTTLMAGISANYEYDLKKIIALSTLSQLGFMMTILMMGFPMLSFFHMIIHALFKASLFLCAGIIIHAMNNNQDIRMMGSLINQMPLTMTLMNMSNLSLCGMPFMSGFYSKDLIMEFMCSMNMNLVIMSFMYLSVGLTSCYSMRLTCYTMISIPNSQKLSNLMDKMNYMIMSIMLLSFYSIISGTLLSWMIFNQISLITLTFEAKIMTLMFSLMGIWFGYEISKISSNSGIVKEFFSNMWFMKQMSTYHNQNLIFNNSLMMQKTVDQGWGEMWSSQGSINMSIMLSKMFSSITLNNFKIQMLSFMIWLFMIWVI